MLTSRQKQPTCPAPRSCNRQVPRWWPRPTSCHKACWPCCVKHRKAGRKPGNQKLSTAQVLQKAADKEDGERRKPLSVFVVPWGFAANRVFFPVLETP